MRACVRACVSSPLDVVVVAHVVPLLLLLCVQQHHHAGVEVHDLPRGQQVQVGAAVPASVPVAGGHGVKEGKGEREGGGHNPGGLVPRSPPPPLAQLLINQ